ncbi:hypothetical protein [Streptomyces sp. NBC_00996]|uniref:hypothetical protein n=1 Tax=Streptomyces sp. NBC_00996 TaxID=2903710 RepID=UPI003866D349|nr:hypothetical protein OG390_17245 [Streptomyces sp. NBC_00996]
MAVWADRVPVEEISERARQVKFWRTCLTVLAGLLFGLGWLAAKAFAVLWLAVVWSATAVKVGWQEGRRGAARPR